jgi:hypothetical protein
LKPDVWAGRRLAAAQYHRQHGRHRCRCKQTDAGAKSLLAEIAKITLKPVTTAIITHSDGVISMVAFSCGIKSLRTKTTEERDGASARPRRPPADRLPTQVDEDEGITDHRRVKLELYHFAPAQWRRPGGLSASAKIVSTGDLVVTNRDDNPNIHYEKNGSTEG